MVLPGFPARVHDAYVAGEGIVHVAWLLADSEKPCWRGHITDIQYDVAS